MTYHDIEGKIYFQYTTFGEVNIGDYVAMIPALVYRVDGIGVDTDDGLVSLSLERVSKLGGVEPGWIRERRGTPYRKILRVVPPLFSTPDMRFLIDSDLAVLPS
jgi:hypothetical protein